LPSATAAGGFWLGAFAGGPKVKKADAELGEVDESLLQQDEEKALYAAAQDLQPKIGFARVCWRQRARRLRAVV